MEKTRLLEFDGLFIHEDQGRQHNDFCWLPEKIKLIDTEWLDNVKADLRRQAEKY